MTPSFQYLGDFYNQKDQFETDEEFSQPLMGLDDNEIAKISNFHQRKLPLAYEELLRIAGRNFFVAFNYGVIQHPFDFDEMVKKQELLKQILIREKIYQGNEIVVGSSEYEFSLYIRFGEGDNSPVYIIIEYGFDENHFKNLVDFVDFQIKAYKSRNQ
jgi:hypothetical protein